MKKFKIFAVALVCFTMQSLTSFAGNHLISVNELPAPAIQFVADHFGNNDITTIEKGKQGFKTTYTVMLNDGTSISFQKNGKWKTVKCVENAVPESIVPSAIANYVTRNHPGQSIVEIANDMMGYEVELSNRVDLSFFQDTQLYGMNF